MRLLLKVLLFPITLSLSIVIAFGRFISELSSALLAIAAVVVFAIALGTLILLKDPAGALVTCIGAFVISPYGLPKLAEWLIDRLEDLNFAIKSI